MWLNEYNWNKYKIPRRVYSGLAVNIPSFYEVKTLMEAEDKRFFFILDSIIKGNVYLICG